MLQYSPQTESLYPCFLSQPLLHSPTVSLNHFLQTISSSTLSSATTIISLLRLTLIT